MLLKHLTRALALVALLGVPAAAQQTVDEIVAKNIAARGGKEKLMAVKTIRMTGKLPVGPGLEAPLVLEQKRPNNLRMEFTIQGMTGVQAYDGSGGWMLMPFQGKKDPEAIGEDDRKELAEQADIDGPLLNYKEKGNKVELVGKEQVEGTDAYKLKITLKNGSVRYYYLDADTFLDIKQEGKRTIRGTEVETEATLGDYKEVDGLMLPFSVENGVKGSPNKQKITIDKIEINPVIEDARFKMPTATTAPAGNKPAVKPENKESESKPADKKPPMVTKKPV